MASTYQINKGINRSIEMKGLKAQYIIYLAIGLVILLIGFIIAYMAGANSYLCVGVALPLGFFYLHTPINSVTNMANTGY